MKANRLVLLAVAGVATLSLSGCSESGGNAAEVGDDVVSTSDVSFLTRMQCDALDSAAKDPAQAAQVQTTSTRLVRAQMVNALVQSTLNAQLADKEGADYDRATYRQVMDQFEPAVQAAPAEDQDRFRDLVGQFYQGQLEIFALAQRELSGQGVQEPTDAQMEATVGALQDQYRKSVTVKINPVYGPDASGVAGVTDPSLSVPVSSFAKQASSSSPAPEFVATLPANLRCG